MRVREITTTEGLAALAADWRRLAAGHPLLGPEWLATWWRHFGTPARQLCVLAVDDPREGVVAVAPWYLERATWPGRTLRFLGTGAVCTDYLTLPCAAGFPRRAATAIADWLCPKTRGASSTPALAWDALALEGVTANDPLVRYLAGALERRGAVIDARPADSCWRLELPAQWEDYLALVSRPHRKRIRRFERAYFDTRRARLLRAETPDEWERGFAILVDLHARRWASRGEQGVFADATVRGFHREATRELLAAGQLRLGWLELDGRPVAAEYSLAGDGVIYAYQSGMDPNAEGHAPGTLALIATLRAAMEEGYQAIDFLRGDEPYKQHWRAGAWAMQNVRVFPARWSGRLHHAFWQSGTNAKSWLRASRRAVRAGGGIEEQPSAAPAAERDEVVSIPMSTVTEVH